jgi:SprT protein|tara:strand:+ start:4007 stop:4624 length:618 start_codon:yes stop_codon:yes gene_type:complete
MRPVARQMEFGFHPVASEILEVKSQDDVGIAEACSRLMGIDDELTAICSRLCLMQDLPDLAARVGVEWNPRMRSTAGRATWPICLIELNTHLPKISQEEVLRTLLHELAHLVTYERLGHGNCSPHGEQWQQACSDLGIPGESATHRLPLPSRKVKRQWKYLCPSCGSEIERVRRFKSRVACYQCCQDSKGGYYNERFRLVEISLT